MRKAEAELLKLQAELAKLKQEHRHAQSIREEVNRDAATTQKQLEGSSHYRIFKNIFMSLKKKIFVPVKSELMDNRQSF